MVPPRTPPPDDLADEEPEEDTYDRFIRNGQYPVRK